MEPARTVNPGEPKLMFQSGGTLKREAFYISRPADEALLQTLVAGEFAYVLAPRQIGKSSLRLRTELQLKDRGIRCVSIDLTGIGSNVEEGAWYQALAFEISRKLKLPGTAREFWQAQDGTSMVQRWMLFLETVVLPALTDPVVIFIDEIDSTRSLSFSADDFFAAIRATYNARADAPGWRKLTFCLLGVSAPADLISDETRTPFNIGQRIPLEDFTSAQIQLFREGLETFDPRAEQLLESIYAWTSGHPYMTQRLCQAAQAEGPKPGVEVAAQVEQLVERLFLQRGRVDDASLSYAEKHFAKERTDPRTPRMLQLYRRLRQGERVTAAQDDPIQQALRLTGMAATRVVDGEALLRVRNRIYAIVFDDVWVKEISSRRFLSEQLGAWVQSGRSDDFLLRGAALDEAQAWAQGRSDLNTEEQEFLLAGLLRAAREERARADEQQVRAEAERLRTEVERQEQQRLAAEYKTRKRTLLTAVVAVALPIVSMSVASSYYQSERAKEAEQVRVAAEKKLAESEQQLEKARTEVQKRTTEAQQALEVAEKANASANIKGGEANAAIRRGDRIEKQLESVRAAWNAEKDARAKLDAALQAERETTRGLNNELSSTRNLLSQTNTALARLRESAGATEKQLADYKTTVDSLKQQLERSERRIEYLNEQIAYWMKAAEDAKALLQEVLSMRQKPQSRPASDSPSGAPPQKDQQIQQQGQQLQQKTN